MTGLPRNYKRLPDGTLEPCEDQTEFIQWYNQNKDRTILRTAVPYGDFKKAVLVETVFTGCDFSDFSGAPTLFETRATMPNDTALNGRGAPTEKEARKRHWTLVEEVKRKLASDPEYREFSEGLEELFTNPGDPPKPGLRGPKPPETRAPSPTCPKCHGHGTLKGLIETIPCDCTIVPR